MARNTGLNAATSGACAAAVSSATCADLFANKVEACVIKGSVGDGLRCGADSQCASGLCRRAGDVCGLCAVKSPAGGPCRKDKNEDCQLGLVCADQQCAAPAGEGAACSKKVPCAFGLYCSGRTATCTKPVAAPGAPCEKDGCDLSRNLVCNEQAKVCQIFRVAQPGEACGIGISPPTLCPFGEFEKMCRPNVLVGVCARPALEGEPCGSGGPECLAPAYCDRGTCRLASASACPTP
jgi:hypothetical protein